MSTSRSTPPTRLGDVLRAALDRMAVGAQLADYALWVHWEAVVGPTVARHARPGNWLPSGKTSRFVLVLRLYDSSLTGASGTIDAKKMPVLVKGACE